MSVRDFATHPCPVCKCDTTHIAMRCQDCGSSQDHPHEQFEKRFGMSNDEPVPRKRSAKRKQTPLRSFVQARRDK